MIGILLYLLVLLISLIIIYSLWTALFFRREIQSALKKDPAAGCYLEVLTLYPGLHSIVIHRLTHLLYSLNIPFIPRFISEMMRFFTGIEIHPGAKIGKGLFIDHGNGIVIGETAIIGDDCLLYQGVTLVGTGKEKGKRHPTLGNNVVIGAGANILGDIHIGDNVSVGANAVVVRDVPANSTVVGVPGRIASREGKKVHGINLDHTSLPDPLTQALEKLQHEIDKIENELKEFGSDEKKHKK